MHNQELGRLGEDLALKYLQQKNYKVIARNFYCKWGELDLVTFKNNKFHFIEVKTRSNLNKGRPEEALTFRKRQSLARAIYIFRQRYQLTTVSWQLDVVSLIYNSSKNRARIKYIPNISVDRGPGYSVI